MKDFYKKLMRLFITAVFLFGFAQIGVGQILTFEFSALVGDEASANSNSNDANLTSSTITRGSGLTASANGGRYNATSWALTSIANAVTGNDYMEFTITPNSGYQFSVSSIYIQLQRSDTGPRGIAIRSSVDSYTSNLDQEYSITDNTSTQNFTFTFTQSNSSSAVTYRVYKWAEATGGSGGIGDGAGNDIIVNGSVTATGPEMDVQGNSTSIADGDATPTTADHTDFGSTDITSGTIDRTFTIYNTGTSNLTLSGTPIVVVGGTHSADFTVTSQPTSPVVASGNTTFTVRFNPSATGTRSATLSIANDDTDENPYNFSIQGTGTNDVNSTVTAGAGAEPGTIASTVDTDGEEIQVFDFIFTDVGAAGDGLATIIDQIQITQGDNNDISDWTDAIAGAYLSGTDLAVDLAGTVNSTNITFASDDMISVANGANETYSLKIYLNTDLSGITDNDTLEFKLDYTDITEDAAGSSFGSGAPESGDDKVVITITATQLLFIQQPTNTNISTAMSPNPTVKAADVNGNIDVDYSTAISVSSDGTMTGDPVSGTWSSGTATFSSLTHTATGTGLTLTASSGTFDDEVSGTFDIITPAVDIIDDYDATDHKTYTTDGSGTSCWDRDGTSEEYEAYTNGFSAPEHSFASYDLSSSLSGYTLSKNNENAWCGWMDLNRTSVSGWGAANYSCGMVLAANNADFNNSSVEGYAVGFNNADEHLVVFKFNDGIQDGSTDLPSGATEIVDCGYLYSDGDNGVNFYVEYLPDGKWKIYYKSGAQLSAANAINKANYDDGDVTSASADETYTGFTYKYAGWIYSHSSGAEEAYFDNFGAGGDFTCEEPTTHASAMTFSNVATTSMTVGWTSGNGSNRIVVAKQGAAPDWSPTDTNTYTADASFGSGTELGTGNYVVYNGNGNTVDVTNLAQGTTYYYKIFEYNCNPGSEDYLVNGSALTGNETTLISNVQNLSASCVTNTTVLLDWDAPAGSYDSIFVTVRQGGVPSDPTCEGQWLTSASTVYTSATTYCGNSTDSRYVYNGTGNTVTVTALTNTNSYTFKVFTYQGSDWSSGTQITKTIDLVDVSNANATRGNAEVDLSWTIPANCFDEIMIVGKDTTTNSTITASPSGNGSLYTANSVFGTGGSGANLPSNEYCVYKGTGTNLTVTNLKNDSVYCFKIFVRKGTEWTGGVEVFEKPMDITIIEPGDLMIMAVNTNNALISGEEFTFVCFQPIKVGTPIDFTDNGYEREYDNEWGTSEGTIRLTRTAGGTLAAGTTVTVVMNNGSGGGTTAAHFDIFVNGTDELASNWTIGWLNSSDGSGFNLNGNDDIWIMQNGSWVENKVNPPDPFPQVHDDDYTGNVLYGWTATGWGVGTGSDLSELYPYSDCFQTNISVANNGKVKYSGDLSSSATQLEWIARVNDSGNWTTYSSDVLYDATTTNLYRQSGFTIPITAGGYTDGVWTGSQNTDWFDCGNWQSLTVPDETIDVVIGASAADSVSVNNASAEAAKYGGIAKCNNLTVSNKALLLEGSVNDTLEVYGNLTINSGGVLDMDDAAKAIDGHLYLYGNWNNQAGAADFKEGEGTVHLVGTGSQTISTNSFTEDFNQIISDNSFASGISLSNDIRINGEFSHTDGDINLNGNNIDLRSIYSRTTGTFIGNASSDFSLNGSGSVADLSFINNVNLNNFTINRANENVNILSDLSINTNLTITAGSVTLTAGNDYDVGGTLINTLNTAAALVLKSDAGGTASLIQNAGAVPATVERYLTGDNWHCLFAPLTQIDTSVYTVTSWGPVNPNVFWYDEPVADYWTASVVYNPTGWKPADSISSQYFQTDRGYIHHFTTDKVFSQTGGVLEVANKDFSVTITDNGTGNCPAPVSRDWDNFEGWNLIGNPFTAAIDWDAVTKNNIESGMYCYDDTQGKYQYYISGGGDSPWDATGVTVNSGSQYIPAGQGFFVKATGSGTLTLAASARTHNSQGFWKKSGNELTPDLLRLQIEKDNYTDETVIRTLPPESEVTNEHDGYYDAYKMFAWNNDKPQLFSRTEDNKFYFALNSLPEISGHKIVPLGVYTGIAGEYSIRMTENNFENTHIWIEDTYLSTEINLLDDDSFIFTQAAEDNSERFFLHFGKNTAPVLNANIPDQNTSVNLLYEYIIPGNIFIDIDFEDELSLSASLSSGDDLPEWLTFDSDLEQFFGTPDEVQTLSIKVTATDIFGENVSDEFILYVKSSSVEDIAGYINVYPNPTNGLINIEFSKRINNAVFKVKDVTGQVVLYRNINSNKSVIDLSGFAGGIYIIEIISGNSSYRGRIIKN